MRILLAAIALLVLLGYSSLIVWSVPRVPLAVNANPVRGSVWTWLGPTIGADGTPLPASRATTYVNVVSAFGAHPDGATDNSSVFTMIFGDANGDTMFFPPGVYRLSCGHAYSASSSISLVGAGQGQSIIRFDTGCNLPYGGTFLWTNKSRVQLQNLTIDLNSPDTPSGGPLGIPVYIYATSAILGPVIDNIGIINRLSPTWELAIIAQSGGLITNPIVTNSYFSLMTAANIQNQCIALYASQATGTIVDNMISNNVCVNIGIQIDGNNGIVSNNDVSGYAYGTGIFGIDTQKGWPAISCSYQTFTGNTMHNGTTALDVNHFSQAGMEMDCPHSIVSK